MLLAAFRSPRRLGTACFAWLLLVALLLRSLVPVGYMPDFANLRHQAGLSIMPCHGADAVAMPQTAPSDHGGQQEKHKHSSCIFALGGIFSFAGVSAPVLVPLLYAGFVFYLIGAMRILPQRRYGFAFARAPPR